MKNIDDDRGEEETKLEVRILKISHSSHRHDAVKALSLGRRERTAKAALSSRTHARKANKLSAALNASGGYIAGQVVVTRCRPRVM